jgi:glycosyltransferase involved in cell wall biosynthesis
MSLKDKITIVVPSKNEQDYIGHLLDDLAKQVSQEVQIIIADASKDNTRKVIATKKQQHGLKIKVVQGGPVSEAKNNGAFYAQTPYLLFIDADVRFFSHREILDSVEIFEKHNLDLLGLRVKCYDGDIRAQIGFMIFNFVNRLLQHFVPFAVGAFMLTRKDRFEQLGGFPCRYVTSEDFFLSKMYSPKKFKLAKHFFGQDSRRFKKMGYLGMAWYLIKNFANRNNHEYWQNIDARKYWN